MKIWTLLSCLALLASCDDEVKPSGDDTAVTDDTGNGGDDTDTGGSDACADEVGGDIPEEAEWIILDGESTQLFTFAEEPFTDSYAGYAGTYDLNTEEVYGANGFKLERPGRVVGVSVRWGNVFGDEPQPATVWLFPDFGSDGYVFDPENPYQTVSRCVTEADDGEWIDYALDEPIVLDNPLHVYAGYHRGTEEDAPEIYMENTYNEVEPYFSGVRWREIDRRYYYLGMVSPWYTWQVRLAVIYDDEVADEDKLFTIDEALSASSRVSWGDYDNDGDDDVMTNGPTLYQNNGDGTFTNVTSTAIPSYENGASGGVWGDYDNDGCLDYFGMGGGASAGELLLHSLCDGTFEDVTVLSGINDLQSEVDCNEDGQPEDSPTEGAAWWDFDDDGLLDLYLANTQCYGGTYDYTYYDDRLWRNNGDGSFTDYSELVEQTNKYGRAPATNDFDWDGDTDLFVGNYRLAADNLWENLGDGTVQDIARSRNVRGDNPGHSIGAVWGDIDNDGDFDLVVGTLLHPFWFENSDRTRVYVNDGTGNFEDDADGRGIYYRETHSVPDLLDADNDGDLDLYITSVYPDRDSDFYLNDGDGNFTLYNYESGSIVRNGWGVASSDYDMDGDVDLLAYSLLRNQTQDNGNHWLQVRAVGGVVSNRSAIGANVRVTVGELSMLRHVSGGNGSGVQDSWYLSFGLGSEAYVDEIEVSFPGGQTVVVEGVEADQRVWVFEDGTVATGWEPPE